MGAVGGLGAVVSGAMADAAIQMRREADLMRDTEAQRAETDLEAQMALKAVESQTKQNGLNVSIATTGANGVRAGVEAGQNIQALGEQNAIKGSLNDAIQNRGTSMDRVLDTDLGGKTVAQVLGGEGPQGREIAARKMDMILSGNFSSADDLQAAGFTEAQAKQLMGLKESGGRITMDEAVDFVYAQGPHAAEVSHLKDVHQAIDKSIGAFQQVLSFESSRRLARHAGTRESLAGDRELANQGREGANRLSWLATENLTQAAQGLVNKRNQTKQG